jgi:cell division protein FtsZ
MAGMGYAVMGTAVRSGANRALEAAQAAMASPLLEDGAIDGARGILINISGSSSLKLNEVNEASSLIQNAAHEDANIIFGAVLDEAMGDEVKITVIATGFKQESAERRDRMLQAASMPVTPSIEIRPGKARFASEVEADDDHRPVLVPVSARDVISAFSDSPRREEFRVIEPASHSEPEPAATSYPEPEPEPVFPEPAAIPEPARFEEPAQERDDLEIPAFMRHSNY